jgi:hypothetical protein
MTFGLPWFMPWTLSSRRTRAVHSAVPGPEPEGWPAMLVYCLVPTDPSGPEWQASTHRSEAVIRVGSESEARGLAAAAFRRAVARKAKSDSGRCGGSPTRCGPRCSRTRAIRPCSSPDPGRPVERRPRHPSYRLARVHPYGTQGERMRSATQGGAQAAGKRLSQ